MLFDCLAVKTWFIVPQTVSVFHIQTGLQGQRLQDRVLWKTTAFLGKKGLVNGAKLFGHKNVP